MKCLCAILMLMVVQLSPTLAEIYNLSPSCSSSFACTTLANLDLPSSDNNISLILAEGTHSIASFSLANSEIVSLTGVAGETIIQCTPTSSYRYSADVSIQSVDSITIKDLTFSGCGLSLRSSKTHITDFQFLNATVRTHLLAISNSYEVEIDNSIFADNVLNRGFDSVIDFHSCQNVKITRSNFTGSTTSSYGSVIDFHSCRNVEITRSNFTGSTTSSYGSVIDFHSCRNVKITRSSFTGSTARSYGSVINIYNTTGFISCCDFNDNTARSYSGIIKTEGFTSIYVTNTTFTRNSLSSYGGIILLESSSDYVAVISSLFTYNNAGYYSGVINLDSAGEASVLASELSHNTAPAINVDSSSGHVTVDCTRFRNNTSGGRNPNSISFKNTSFCWNSYRPAQLGVCGNSACDVCRPPTVSVGLEYTQYEVSEDLRHDHYALQVCAVTTGALFPVNVAIEPVNGTAYVGQDFIALRSGQRDVDFTISETTQRRCTFYEIIDDKEIEGNEQFAIQLVSSNQQVTVTNQATVTIVDNDGNDGDSEYDDDDHDDDDVDQGMITIAPITDVDTTVLTKTVLVECGIFNRPVVFNSTANGVGDKSSLISAITQTFPGLQQEYIALLKVRSTQYGGYYIDMMDSDKSIESHSYIKVVIFSKFQGICLV